MFLKLLQHFIYFHNRAKHYKENYLPSSWTSCSFPLQCVFPGFQFGSQGGPKLLSNFIFQHGQVRGHRCFSRRQPPPLSGAPGLFGGGGPSLAPPSAGLRGAVLPQSTAETPAVTVARLGAPATVVISGTSPQASGPSVGLALG